MSLQPAGHGSGIVRVSAEWVALRLEEAGTTELLLSGAGCRPAGFRTAWPDAPREWMAYGASDAEPALPVPSASDIARYDEVRRWISAGVRNERHRHVLGLRMLTWWAGHHRAGEPVHSWSAIGRRMHVHHKTVQTWWLAGVDAIVRHLRQAALERTWAARPAGAGLCGLTGGPVGPGAAETAAAMASRSPELGGSRRRQLERA